MYAVYDGENAQIYATTTEGDACAYVTEAGIVCDTSRWIVLPIEIV